MNRTQWIPIDNFQFQYNITGCILVFFLNIIVTPFSSNRNSTPIIFNTCAYLVTPRLPPALPVSHCHLHCCTHKISSSLCPCSDTLHEATPHYRNPSQPLPGSNTPHWLAATMMGLSLHPACAMTSCFYPCIQSLCLLLLSLFGVSDFHARPPSFHWECPSHPAWALTTHSGLLPTPHLLAQILNCLAPTNGFLDKFVQEGRENAYKGKGKKKSERKGERKKYSVRKSKCYSIILSFI